MGKLEKVFCLDASEEKEHSYHYWLKKAEQLPLVPACSTLTQNDLATLIYTSGTTGHPKGVELTHQNISSNIQGLKSLLAAEMGRKISLAFLPWAHVFGQVNELHSLISTGSTLAIVPNRDQILECIQIVKPTILYAVPIMLNRIYDGIMKGVDSQSPIKKAIFHYALKVARQRNHRLEFKQPVSSFLEWKFQKLDKLVFSKVRERLGGRVQRIGAGGAAAGMEVLQFFEDIGLSVVEGYGLSETSPTITAGSVDWEYRRLGCVGVPLHGIDVKIVDPETLQPLPSDTDGEITVSGPIVMKGYHNNPKATQEVFFQLNGQQYFRTGDLGRMVEGKFLKITGRIKEQFKLENGKFVVPAPLEDIFSRGPMIAQSFLYGFNKKNTVLLIVPNYLEWQAWATKHKRADLLSKLPEDCKIPSTFLDLDKDNEKRKKLEEFFKDPKVIAKITKEIVKHSVKVKSYERPVKWTPVLMPFAQENQMMTAKLSLRRNNIIKAYEGLIEALYTENTGYPIEYPASDEKQ